MFQTLRLASSVRSTVSDTNTVIETEEEGFVAIKGKRNPLQILSGCVYEVVFTGAVVLRV